MAGAAACGPGATAPPWCSPARRCCRRSGAAAHAADQRWSSARCHLGLERQPLLSDCPALWALGNTPFEREAAYRQLLDEGLPTDQARALGQASRQGWAVGDADFLAELARHTDRPLAPRPRGRPRRRPAAKA